MRQRGPCRVAPVRRAGSSVYFCLCLRPLLLLLPSVHFSLPFPFSLRVFFFIRHFPFPVRSIDRHACRKPGNVTSLIIGVVKRVVRNNYEPVSFRGRRRCVTRAPRRAAPRSLDVVGLQSISSLAREARFRIYRARRARHWRFNFAESNGNGARIPRAHLFAARSKNKQANYVSTD